MCRHLNVLAYMSASWCVGIFMYMSVSGHVNILASTRTNMLTNMSAYLSPLASRMSQNLHVFGIYFNILICRHICRHLDMSTFGQHKNKCVDMYVGIFATTSEISRHLYDGHHNMPTYMSTHFRVLATMPAYSNADIYVDILLYWHNAGRLSCRRMSAFLCRHTDCSISSDS